ncbi:MAG TPA: glycosyltransferase, partial [Gemmatimonadaceae bacterium]|nr:glycosyltransferase [Gemmatimonadaceae bacterium]
RQSGDINMRTMAGASNKAFDYLACGVPMLVSDVEDWRDMFARPGYARVVDSTAAESIVDALCWAVANRGELRAMGARGQQRIRDDWNYEHQFDAVARRLLSRPVQAIPATGRMVG